MIEGDPGPSKDAADPLVGKVLNERFSIIDVIGTGGMGRVYKAIQAPLDRVVALKVLNPHYGAAGRDPNFQRRFFLEASMTSKLRHPNTITVIDYGRTDDGIFYIAMEYVEGQTLAQTLSAHGPLPWQRALHITQQICRSLREAHKQGIIHRDLKPANVMLLSEETDQDVVKVLDFGLVKSLTTDGEAEITQAGMMLGSPLYMAPEQARHIADVRTDIYSLGVVLFQMLMGRPPFQAKESVDAIVKHISQKPPTFAQTRPDLSVPPELEAVVMKCLEKEPARRFQSMDELLDALRAAAASNGVSGVFSDRSSPMISAVSAPAPIPAVARASIPDDEMSQTRPERSLSGRVIEADDIPVLVSGVQPIPETRRYLFAAIFAASLLAGGGIVWWLTARAPSPEGAVADQPGAQTSPDLNPAADPQLAQTGRTALPQNPPQPPAGDKAPTSPQQAQLIRFRIASEPPGARVFLGDKALGTAPLEHEVPAGSDGVAEATLTFNLDGYLPHTVTARGQAPEVAVTEKLQRKPAGGKRPTRPTRPKDDDGYKDDPY